MSIAHPYLQVYPDSGGIVTFCLLKYETYLDPFAKQFNEKDSCLGFTSKLAFLAQNALVPSLYWNRLSDDQQKMRFRPHTNTNSNSILLVALKGIVHNFFIFGQNSYFE